MSKRSIALKVFSVLAGMCMSLAFEPLHAQSFSSEFIGQTEVSSAAWDQQEA
jgi:hypothetical protein